MRDQGVSFYDTVARNRPVNIPNIEFYLLQELGIRKRGLLPGNIWLQRDLPATEDYEELGADYDEEDDDLSYMFGGVGSFNDDDDIDE
ncbi:hypothetical protein C6T59_16140 [Burkholderia multivorans]|nr:hypothetical protein C6Q01_15580 [Burkholderia multivorans]PRF85222.1 hypothetical protein C6Q23_27600 [Burkholderia multivorans]PRG65243.1 hypothetical protein C6T59_16140 [Burkholderia multivorans]